MYVQLYINFVVLFKFKNESIGRMSLGLGA